jgi:hypothetical protein
LYHRHRWIDVRLCVIDCERAHGNNVISPFEDEQTKNRSQVGRSFSEAVKIEQYQMHIIALLSEAMLCFVVISDFDETIDRHLFQTM